MLNVFGMDSHPTDDIIYQCGYDIDKLKNMSIKLKYIYDSLPENMKKDFISTIDELLSLSNDAYIQENQE